MNFLLCILTTLISSNSIENSSILVGNNYKKPITFDSQRGTCGDITVTQNVSCDTLTTSGISCGGDSGTGANVFARNISITDGSEGSIFCIDFGVSSLTIDTEVNIELFGFAQQGTPITSSLIPLTEQLNTIPTGENFIHRVVLNTPVDVISGDNIVVTITVPDLRPQEAFFYYAGNGSTTGSTYILSPDCGINDFTDIADIGFPDNQMLMCLGINSDGFDPCQTPVTTYCPEDINTDFFVNTFDLLSVISDYGTTGDGTFRPTSDIAPLPNGDCVVNTLDLLAIVSQLGADCTPIGACCYNDGSCSNENLLDCTNKNGTYQGDFTTCETIACSRGTCCLADLSCEERSEDYCIQAGGIFTPWLRCNEITCGPGSCCLDEFTCLDNFNELSCNKTGGTYLGNGTVCSNISCGQTPPLEKCEGTSFTNGGESLNAGTSDNSTSFTRYTKVPAINSCTSITVTGITLRNDIDGGFVSSCNSIDTFEISCYLSDSKGLPDLSIPIFTDNNIAPNSITNMNIPFNLTNLFEYTFELNLNGLNTDFWISVKGNGNEDCWFLWANSLDGYGESAVLDESGDTPRLTFDPTFGPLSICIDGDNPVAACCLNGTCVGDITESECLILNGTFEPFENCSLGFNNCGCNIEDFSTAGTADEGAGFRRASVIEGFSLLNGFSIKGIEYNYDPASGFTGECASNESLTFDVSVVAIGADGLPDESIVFYSNTLNENSINTEEEFGTTTIYDYNFDFIQPVVIPGEATIIIQANSPCNSSGCEVSQGGCWFLWLDTTDNQFTGFLNDGSGWIPDISLSVCGN